MAGGTSPPHGATRFVETTRGVLSYTQLAPLLAERALVLERTIASGGFAAASIAPDLICDFHRRLCGDLVPEWAGCWRKIEVRVGDYTPPPPFKVAALMTDYAADLQVRLADAGSAPAPSLLTEHLAFAEGRMLSIHPFADFNGRVTRLWLRELLYRLEMPNVDLVPATSETTTEYLDALRRADALDWSPLQRIWVRRLEAGFNDHPEM